MRIDWYTKGVLTVIAVLLGMVVSKLYAAKPPEPVVQPEAAFAGLEWGLGPGSHGFFDSRTGDIWLYNGEQLTYRWRLNKPGAQLTVVK